ncbi:MAG: hypothetical protein ACOZBZ_04410 [Patescibacteria group bacterium]
MEAAKLKILSIDIFKANKGEVIARADIHFDGFLVKGFKVLRDESGANYVTPPSYLSPHGWRPIFKTDSPEDWQAIKNGILKSYDEYLMKEAMEEPSYEKDMF